MSESGALLPLNLCSFAAGPDFAKYMAECYPYLEMGLQNFEEYQVCAVTVGVVGDICRAIEEKIAPFCDGIMKQLLTDLSSETLHRSVKPAIFSCCGQLSQRPSPLSPYTWRTLSSVPVAGAFHTSAPAA